MKLRSIGTQVFGAAIVLASSGIGANAQVAGSGQSSSASHVAAEMTKGKLNPANSKPGDTVALKLKDDVRSNGEVVLKRGTMITGVVRNVKRSEPNGSNSAARGEVKTQAQSMMEIEWFVPPAQGKAMQNVSVALQTVTQVNPIYQHEQQSASDDFGLTGAAASTVARPVRNAGLTASAVGAAGAVDAVGLTSTADVVTASSVTSGSATSAGRVSGLSNAALLSMPTVVAVDHQTSSAIESDLGTTSSGTLFKVGHGQLVTAGGSQQSVEIFSHLSNDTVITSPSKNFEISSGAQMQLLVGVNRK